MVISRPDGRSLFDIIIFGGFYFDSRVYRKKNVLQVACLSEA